VPGVQPSSRCCQVSTDESKLLFLAVKSRHLLSDASSPPTASSLAQKRRQSDAKVLQQLFGHITAQKCRARYIRVIFGLAEGFAECGSQVQAVATPGCDSNRAVERARAGAAPAESMDCAVPAVLRQPCLLRRPPALVLPAAAPLLISRRRYPSVSADRPSQQSTVRCAALNFQQVLPRFSLLLLPLVAGQCATPSIRTATFQPPA
jgi:hypothetical protein